MATVRAFCSGQIDAVFCRVRLLLSHIGGGPNQGGDHEGHYQPLYDVYRVS